MKRLVVAIAVLLALPAAASAKEIAGAKVCGASECREVKDERGLMALHGTYTWMPVSAQAVRSYRRMIRGIAPIPAAKLKGVDAELPQARVDQVVQIAPDEDAGGTGAWAWLAAGGLGLAALLAVLLVGLRRGRPLPWPRAVRSRP